MNGWRVELEGLSLAEEDVTVAQAADIARLAGGGWETLDPLRSPACAAAIVAVMKMAAGMNELEAVVAVNAMPMLALLDSIKNS